MQYIDVWQVADGDWVLSGFWRLWGGEKIVLTKRKRAGIIGTQNIRERVDGKKYLCLKADRELPVGERREKDLGNIHPGAAGLKGE